MIRKVTLQKMGGSIGATLPSDIADRLHLEAGDELSSGPSARTPRLSSHALGGSRETSNSTTSSYACRAFEWSSST